MIAVVICLVLGLIMAILLFVTIILAQKAVPEPDPTEYGWELLKETGYNVLAYNKREFVLAKIDDQWVMYSIPFEGAYIITIEKLTVAWLEYVDNYIERYHD